MNFNFNDGTSMYLAQIVFLLMVIAVALLLLLGKYSPAKRRKAV